MTPDQTFSTINEGVAMKAFRALLGLMFITIAAYSAATIASHGPNLLPVFFGDIAKLDWPGQFDLDFMGMLALSAIWVAWRHQFSPPGLILAIVAFFGGTLFLTAYLTVVILKAGGDAEEVLIGPSRSKRRAQPRT